MSTELATMPARPPAARPMSRLLDITQNLDGLWNLATLFLDSRLLPSHIDSPQKAVTIILKGDELGIAPMHALDGITVIQGKPTISPQLMLSLIERSGMQQDISVSEAPDACTITATRKGRSPQVVRFDKAEATSMGLWGKGNWLKMPGTMMYWRCVAKMARRVYPDVIAGCYTPEEMGAEIGDEGEILDPAAPPPGQKFPDQGGPGRSGSYASEDVDGAFKKMMTDAGRNLQESWLNAWASANQGEFPAGLPEMPVRSHEVIMELYNTAVIGGLLKPVETTRDEDTGKITPRASIEQLRKMVAILFGKDPAGVQRAAGLFMERRAMEVALEFAQASPAFSLPDDFNPEFNLLDDFKPEDESQEAPEPLPVVEAPKKLGKKELAEQVRLRLEAEKKAKAAQPDRGDAFEEPEPALAEGGR